ncbi:MAG TPA: ATP-dependent helicase HrpB [Bdellovibrionota bacterium]|jgi:ATP-dependent helicase HrpB
MKPALPIDPFLPELLKTLSGHGTLVLSAAPGAGKTTRLPPELLQLTEKTVLVLEPRRIAAISASQRVAEERRWELGREVGYQVRFDKKTSRQTRLIFLTEALLLRKLLRDPELKEVGCVVLDEFHERSLHVDLALGALKELRELARPDLKIVVMSATLDTKPIAGFLGGAPVAEVPGKLFSLAIRYDEKSQILRAGPDLIDRMQRLVQKAAAESPEGDLLCFLPGRGEIERLRQALEGWAEVKHVLLLPLHGQLDLAEQKAALAPARQRKVILATNVAESSLTVDGVRVVVDSGLARISQLHPRTGFASLDLCRISKASAIQRAGRAARQAEGTVYRAWIPHDELSMKEFEPAEVLRSDLSESLLLLSALGLTRFESFSWYEPPPAAALTKAEEFLRTLGALHPDGSLTALGRSLRELPVHPRIAKLLLIGKERGQLRLACELAALLSEPGGKLSQGEGSENDLWVRRQEWRRSPSHPRNRSLERAARQLSELLEGNAVDSSAPQEEDVAPLLLEIYGDRLCRRRRPHEPQARMAGGRGVKLHPASSVKSSEYFLAIDLSEGRDAAETLVFQAVGMPDALVEERSSAEAKASKRIEWDEEKSRFFLIEGKEWNGLPVGREHRRPADSSELEGKMAELAFTRFDRVLAANADLSAWIGRLRFLHKAEPRWLNLGDEQIRQALELACFGESSLEAVQSKNLISFFEGTLAPEHRDALVRLCPSHWTVPTGNRLRIEYSEEQGPLVEVRLQELFGLERAPKVAGQPLTLVLLGPNFRPVQVTRDLESFWKNGYPEVRKELRARYPKHSWPEDPLTAAPQSKGRPRNT